jgi:hypothetical protein
MISFWFLDFIFKFSFGTKLHFSFYISIFDLRERKSTIEFQCIKRKSLLSPISTTKIVDLGVYMFYLMKEVLWYLFKVLMLPKKIDQSQEKNFIMV